MENKEWKISNYTSENIDIFNSYMKQLLDDGIEKMESFLFNLTESPTSHTNPVSQKSKCTCTQVTDSVFFDMFCTNVELNDVYHLELSP